MNIRDWPANRIMQLPDCCFGRRWLVSCAACGAVTVPAWDIAELSFPEKIVLWELVVYPVESTVPVDRFRLALGDKLPASVAEMSALEPFLPGFGLQGAEPRSIWLPFYAGFSFRQLRQLIHTAGRRLILEVTGDGEEPKCLPVSVVVSSIPTEVPDWLISGLGRSL